MVQTDDFPEVKLEEEVLILKEAKSLQEESRNIPPMFLTPLVGAAVTEGVKFTFECRFVVVA